MLKFKIKPSFVFPRGKYIITDPCYIFDDETWDKLIDEVFYPGKPGEFRNPVSNGVVTVEGFDIWYGMTRHGDGGYEVKRGSLTVGEFGVDAGMYAIIPFEFFERYSTDRDLINQGLGVSLVMGGFAVEYSEGDMKCGGVSVNTSCLI